MPIDPIPQSNRSLFHVHIPLPEHFNVSVRHPEPLKHHAIDFTAPWNGKQSLVRLCSDLRDKYLSDETFFIEFCCYEKPGVVARKDDNHVRRSHQIGNGPEIGRALQQSSTFMPDPSD